MTQAKEVSSGFSDATLQNTAQIQQDKLGKDKSLYSNIFRDPHRHKSLDFSNVGIYSEKGNTDAHMRQFHQTRIYIQNFHKMFRHNRIADQTSTFLITANLPESLNYKISSRWGQPFGGDANGIGNFIAQMAVHKLTDGQMSSTVNKYGYLKIWSGSEPLVLNLTIPVIDDGYTNDEDATGINTNLAEALEFLGSLILPSGFNEAGFYTPPPSPFENTFKVSLGKNIKGKEVKSEFTMENIKGNISVQLGGMLLLTDCIITGLNVEYPNTKTMIRHSYKDINGHPGETGTDYLLPLLAKVTITVETLTAMTSEAYASMLWLKKDQSLAKEEHDLDVLMNNTKNGINSIINKGDDSLPMPQPPKPTPPGAQTEEIIDAASAESHWFKWW